MKTPVRFAVVLSALLLAVLSGCALLSHPAPPRVTLADLQLTDVKLFEQKYRLGLRVQNPNSFELHIEGLDYELAVNDKPFLSGLSGKPVTIAAYGSEIVEVEGFSDLTTVIRQLRGLDKANAKSLPYRLRGHVRLTRGGVRLPFDFEGEFSLGGKREKEKRSTERAPAAPAPRD